MINKITHPVNFADSNRGNKNRYINKHLAYFITKH